MLIITLIVFILGHYGPGDPVEVMLGNNFTEELAESIKAALADAHLVISQKSTDEGTLYAAVANNEIVEAIEKFSGFKIEESQIQLNDQVKEIGLHNIKIRISEDVDFDVVLEVNPESG